MITRRDLDGRAVAVWGAGREGRAAVAAILAVAAPSSLVVVTDTDEPVEEFGADVRSGGAGREALRRAEVVVRSPGISLHRDDVTALRAAGVALTTGTNLWFAERGDEPVAAITATKGKSTTTTLLAHLLAAAGRRVETAGNVGRALLDAIDLGTQPDVWALELSSFQVADLDGSVDVGAALNLDAEHLDWHRSAERYRADKLRLIDDAHATIAVAGPGVTLDRRGPSLRFGVPEETWWVGDGQLCSPGGPVALPPGHRLRGDHNLLNLAAAATVASALGEDPLPGIAALDRYAPLPHRLEPLGRHVDLDWVNDSISTTAVSLAAALRAFADGPVTVILGGHDRGQAVPPVVDALRAHPQLVAVIALPETGHTVLGALPAPVARVAVATVEEAVAAAVDLTLPGGTVLLSPAAPSFGVYRDYADRGERFRAAVAALGAD